MTSSRLLLYKIILLTFPLVVAIWQLPVWVTLALILLLLCSRMVISVTELISPPKTPEVILETIGISHYVEKVRWCMDRLDIDYYEQQRAGVIDILFFGYTVPRLKVRTGAVYSILGNSPEILRFLWGNYHAKLGDKADFLAPTKARLALEQRIDQYGRQLQIWVYYHVLAEPKLLLQLWGRYSSKVPKWQRMLLPLILPLLRKFIATAFQPTQAHYTKIVKRIERFLGEMNSQLADGRKSLLGGDRLNYTDFTMAAISSPWLRQNHFAAGNADALLPNEENYPEAMLEDILRWKKQFPHLCAFSQHLYENERVPSPRKGI